MSLIEARRTVVDNRELVGSACTRALSDAVDAWLADLFHSQIGHRSDIALLAVGGYGRRDLAPNSDLDVLLLHDGAEDIATVAEQLWYPLWDEGVKLGHSVRTSAETMALAEKDLDTATSLLSARHLAGSTELAAALADAAQRSWAGSADSWIPRLAISVKERHLTRAEVAFMLEPDLKEGRGGLRDVHALRWADQAISQPIGLDDPQLDASYEVILKARVELHRVSGRAGDRLLLERQDAVAEELGYDDADDLMADVAQAARRIAWHSDVVWTRLLDNVSPQRRFLRRRPVIVGGPGVTVQDGRARLDPDMPVTAESVLSVAAAAAHNEARLAPQTLALLNGAELDVPDPWPDELRTLFVDLFLASHAAVPVVETLDQLGLFVPYLPEWAPSRSRPQRNAYHRFTVDRHLWETAAEAAKLVEHVNRPDLLVIGALLHDIGKPYPGDHTEVGMELIRTIGPRMGFREWEVDVLVAMCKHHLLLPDVATRRDLDDEDTIRSVADAVGSIEVLHLLHALTEADSIATGPAAWSGWKAGLVRDLAARTEFLLRGGDTSELPRTFPTDDQLAAMRLGTEIIKGEGNMLSVTTPDRPGVVSRIAGAVSLNGLDVHEAAVHTDFGIALAEFRVESTIEGDIDWPKVCASVKAAILGRVAVAARLADRVRTYGSASMRPSGQRMVDTAIKVDNETSSVSTVIEVSAPNGIGLLYQLTRAFSALDLNISSAKVQTLGEDVVDSFYVRDRDGEKIFDTDYLNEIERAIRHAIQRTFAPLEERNG